MSNHGVQRFPIECRKEAGNTFSFGFGFTTVCNWSRSNWFGFGLTTLSWKPLYAKNAITLRNLQFSSKCNFICKFSPLTIGLEDKENETRKKAKEKDKQTWTIKAKTIHEPHVHFFPRRMCRLHVLA